MLARVAMPEEVSTAKYIADQNKKTIGFVLSSTLKEAQAKGWLYVAIHKDCPIAFANVWVRRDKSVTIMEICTATEHRKQGAARKLIEKIQADNAGQLLRLKCPTDNASNEFYKHIGFKLIETLPGTKGKRDLNLWHSI